KNGVTYASDLSSSRPAQTANCQSSTQIATSRTKGPVSPLTSASQQIAFAAFRACSATDGSAVSGSVSASRRSSATTRADGLFLATACSSPSNDESSPARYCWVISPAAPAIETTTAGGESLREQNHAAGHPSRPQAGKCLFGSSHLKGLDGRLDWRGRDQCDQVRHVPASGSCHRPGLPFPRRERNRDANRIVGDVVDPHDKPAGRPRIERMGDQA